jgi:predicted phosphodiesterase
VPPIEHLNHHQKRQNKLKICIISDSHDRSEPLAAAISAAHTAGAEGVIHCCDLIGANTLRASLKLGLPIHVVQGNNIGDTMAVHKLMAKSAGKLIYHSVDATLEMAQGMACMLQA